jgi:hypothetical protein
VSVKLYRQDKLHGDQWVTVTEILSDICRPGSQGEWLVTSVAIVIMPFYISAAITLSYLQPSRTLTSHKCFMIAAGEEIDSSS